MSQPENRPEWKTWYTHEGEPSVRYLTLYEKDEIVLARRAELGEWVVKTRLVLARQDVTNERIITDAELFEHGVHPTWDEVQVFVAELVRSWLAELNVHAVGSVNVVADYQKGVNLA